MLSIVSSVACILLLVDGISCAVECVAPKVNGDPPCKDGAYINLCGVCVGGASGRSAEHGVDRCGVCLGDDLCVGCDGQPHSGRTEDACGRCLSATDPSRDDCIRISRMDPDILDLAVDKISTISLKGANINRTNIPDINCILTASNPSQQTEVPKIERITVEDDVIQLEIIMPQQQSSYNLHCNSSAVNNLTSPNLTLTIVNSKDLSVTSITPTAANIEQSFQPVITVPNVAGHSRVLCFIRANGSDDAQVLLPAAVEGTKIICSNYTAHQAHHLEIGAIFTEDAALEKESQGSSGQITIQASLPSMKEAVLTDDLRYIHIKFDQNVEGPEDCNKIMNSYTMSLLGKEPKCSFTANHLIVKLGQNPSIASNLQIQLSSGCQIFRANSDTKLCAQATGSIYLQTPTEQTAKPKYRVSAPRIVCREQQSMLKDNELTNFHPSYVRLVSSNGQNLRYNWRVSSNLSQVPSKSQSKNLKLWNNIRNMGREMKNIFSQQTGNQIQLNSSLFQTGIQYEFSIVGVNALGMRGEVKRFSVWVDESSSMVDVVILGPNIAPTDAEYYAETKVFTCNQTILSDELQYEWNIIGDIGTDIGLQQGMKLRLPSGIFSAGKKYVIVCTVKLSEEGNILGQGNMTVEGIERGIIAIVATSELTTGTAQNLYLDGSASQDPSNNPGDLKFQWCCYTLRGTICMLPEPGNATPLQTKFSSEFQNSKLILPPKSLAIGEYNFTLHVYKNESNIFSTWTKVIVVTGVPPMVNIKPDIKYHFVDPSEGITIQAAVTNISVGCHVWWEVVQESGFQYFDLKGTVGLGDIIKITEEEANSNLPREVPLYIPGHTGNWSGLMGDTKYKMRLTATCPIRGNKFKQYQGHADVIIQTNTPPVTKPLQVVPNQGEALRTQFEFSTDEAYDSVADMPLQYNFGYRVTGEETNIFSSTNEDLKAYTLLPAEAGEETFITPILQVCDAHKLCTLSEGTTVKTVAPNELTSPELDKILKILANNLATGQYAESLSLTRTSLQTLKKMKDDTLYAKALSAVEKMLVNELKIRRERLKDNPSTIQDSLDFSNMAIQILKELPMSDHILQELLDFKDDILNVISNSVYGQKYRLKRSTTDKHFDAAKETRLSKDSIENYLFLYMTFITHNNKTMVEKGIKNLLKDLETFMKSMCEVTSSEKLYSFGNVVMGMQIKKSNKNNLINKEMKLLTELNPVRTSTNAFIKVSSELLKPCTNPVCIGNTLFSQDYLEKNHSNIFSQINFTRNDFIYGAWVFHTNNFKLTAFDTPAEINLPITTLFDDKKNQEYLCVAWKDGWKLDLCETVHVGQESAPKYITCKCVVSTYIRVVVQEATTTTTTTTTFPTTTILTTTTASTTTTTASTTTTTAATTTTTEATTTTTAATASTTTITNPTTTTTKITTTASTSTTKQTSVTPQKPRIEGKPISDVGHNVSFLIDEDFQKTVGVKEEEFKIKIKKHILDQIDMPTSMIRDLKIMPGSIVVMMTLVDTDVKLVKDVIPLIQEVIGSGKLNVYGLNDEKLRIPSQNVQIMEAHSEEHTRIVTYAVGGVLGASTCSVAVFLISAVIHRRRKEKARMMQLQASAQSKIPTYRKFEFEETIDGTEASLSQYRQNYPTTGTVSTMMGFGMLTGLGTQLNIVPKRNMRYEATLQGSFNSEVHKRKKSKDKMEDQDSGIIDYDGAKNSSKHKSKEKDKSKRLNESLVSLDNLPGTPTDDIQ